MSVEDPKRLSGDVPQNISTAGYSSADAAQVAEAVVKRAHDQLQLEQTSLVVTVYGPDIKLEATQDE